MSEITELKNSDFMQKNEEVEGFEYRCKLCRAFIDQLELVMYSCVC